MAVKSNDIQLILFIFVKCLDYLKATPIAAASCGVCDGAANGPEAASQGIDFFSVRTKGCSLCQFFFNFKTTLQTRNFRVLVVKGFASCFLGRSVVCFDY